MLSRTVVLDDEDPEAFTSLLAGLESTFQPKDEFLSACVESMAVARWRSMRVWAMETAGCNMRSSNRSPSLDLTNSPTRAAIAFRSLCDRSNSVDLLGRYETR